jgi:uncharacterized protein YecT (DUF1311 family)
VAADLTAIFGDRSRPASTSPSGAVAKPPARARRGMGGRMIGLLLAVGACLIAAAALLVLRPWAPRQAREAKVAAMTRPSADPSAAAARPAAARSLPQTAVAPASDLIPMRTSQDAFAPEAAPARRAEAARAPAPAPHVAQARARPLPRYASGRDRPQELASDAAAASAVRTADRTPPAPARAAPPRRCDRTEGVERKAWCMRPQILAADRQLRAAYADAGRAGVSSTDLKHLQGRWTALQRQADTDPEKTLQAYGEIQDTLADLTRDRRARRGEH